MTEDTTKPTIEPAGPRPEKPGVRLPKFPLKTLAAYVAIALVAGLAGYALNRRSSLPSPPPVPTESESGQEPAATAIPEPPPSSEAEMVAGAVRLKIAWSLPSEWFGERFFEQVSTYDASAERPTTYTRFGVVTEGDYKDYSLYRVTVECESLCFGPSTYRLLWKPGAPALLLKKYSDADLESIRGNFQILVDARISDLEFPSTLRGPQGQELVLDNWSWRSFEAAGRRFLFRDARVGDVFIDDLEVQREYVALNGFYVAAPDGTLVVYKVSIPFMREGSVPDLVWASDGSKNTYDYWYSDVSGCGSTTMASVIPAAQVDRARDLVPIGKTATGDTIYGFRDAEHPVLKAIYDAYKAIPAGGVAQSYEEFLASKPVFVWVDPFGRMIKFHRSTYMPAVECGKPVIYLYPEKTTRVSVQIEPKGGLSKSEPSYDGGWNVVARPDGTLTDTRDGSSWPYLFWEGRGGLYETPKRGHIVKREEVPGFLEAQLAAYGLNEKESADFREFWLPRMTASPWYFVTFLTTRAMEELAPLTIEPKPDAVFRLLMDYRPLDAPISVEAPPKPVPASRIGFDVVEWGGVLGRE